MELKFDDTEMDCSLARKYLDEHAEFISFGSSCSIDNGDNFWDITESKIKIRYIESDLIAICKSLLSTAQNNDTKEARELKFQQLASLLLEKKDLIAELEYVLRKVPIADTYVHIELIVKQLKFCNDTFDYNSLALADNSPLLALGSVSNMVPLNGCNLIFTTKYMAVTATLFADLCHMVGLDKFYLIITTESCIDQFNKFHKMLNFKNVIERISGTVGVVTEHSDVESAVDMFLNSSTVSPWALNKIYVQESIYQNFKDALSYKSKLKRVQASTLNQEELSSSKNNELGIIASNDRIFLLDYLGCKTPSSKQPEVFVDGYRTTKELLTFLENVNPFYLSLWSNNIAEANEVAHRVKSPVVWLNNYADLRGPDEACSFLRHTFTETRRVKKTKDVSDLYKIWDSWKQMTYKERSTVLHKVIDMFCQSTGKSTEQMIDLKLELTKLNMNALVNVDTDFICTVIEKPVGIIEVSDVKEAFERSGMMKAILLGNAIVFSSQNELIDIFAKEYIPAAHINLESGDDVIVHSNVYCQNKIIWTNVGTIFAN